MAAISLKDVWLKYRIEFKENEKIVPEEFSALKEINLNVEKGEAVCIIGENGAGKTSLLKIIAGMLKPDKGSVYINGKVSTLMEIGTGFHKDLTGSENIYLISYLFGLTKEETGARYNDIVKFAALDRFINAPVKSYSQGMYMRLGFAIAIHIDPDILLIDDTFAVGDIYTQRKCINKIFELREKGKTIVFVTHDLEMTKRICTRGIFLREGGIVKDGPIDKVCSYYTETVGNKKGIAILQEGSLGIVFNNGKLILRWKDNAITSNSSGHSGMFLSGREYLSTTADWKVYRLKRQKGIIAIGRWLDVPIRQYWKIFFSNEKEFIFEIILKINSKMSIERYETRAIFTDAYKSWFTVSGEEKFPDTFIHLEQWQCVLIDDAVNTLIGVRSLNNTAPFLPTIIFDRSQDNKQVKCCVGNMGGEIGGRLLQYAIFPEKTDINFTMSKYRCFLSTVRIFEPQEQEKLESYLSYASQLTQESKIIRKGALSIFCQYRQVEIYWHDKLLTSGPGFNTKFIYKNKDYSATNGEWDIHKESDEEVVVLISWDDGPPFKQAWRIRLPGNNAILWEIALEVDKEVRIRNKQTKIVLDEGYARWITAEESGDFKRAHKNGTTILNKSINNLIGVERVYKINSLILPTIIFSCEDKLPRATYISKGITYFSKIKDEINATKLAYLEIDFEENLYSPAGRYEYFKGVIIVDSDQHEKGLIKTKEKEESVIIKKGKELARIQLNRLSLIFDYGKGRIYWNEIELTNGLGLYTSVLIGNKWVDSSQAFWEIRKLDKERLVAVGHWPWISHKQSWEISILDEGTLLWKIAKDTWGDIVLEREQANLMVSGCYREWFTCKKTHGEFPREFMSHNAVPWDRLWYGDSVLPIGVKKRRIDKGLFSRKSLPTVIFDCSKDCQGCYPVIENTDNLFHSRLLQYEIVASSQHDTDDAKSKYFEGQIRIIAK